MKIYSNQTEEYLVRHIIFVRVPEEPFGPITRERIYCLDEYVREDYVE